LLPLWDLCVRFVTPVVLLIVLGSALLTDFSDAYEGYSVNALLFIGGGILFVTWLASFILSHIPWKPKKMKTEHKPEEENLLT